MNLNNWRRWAYKINMIGCVQFIILTFLGMVFYKGGTYSDPSTTGYSFFLNYFSDIGRTIALSGESNLVAFVFFSLAFFLVGIMLMPSYIAFPNFFNNTIVARKISKVGSFIGMFSAFCFAGIIFAPSNIYIDAHGFFVYVGFLAGFFSSLLYSIVIFLNKSYPKRYGYNLLILTVILAFYLMLLFAKPMNQSTVGLIIQVTGQKIIIYSFTVCLFIHSYGAWKAETKNKT